MTVISIQRTVAGVLLSATEARLTITNSAGATVVNDIVVAPESAGVYTYDTGHLTPGQYTATWTFEVTDEPDTVVSRVFEADNAAVLTPGCMLMEIEQGLARRVGRYYRFKSGDTSTVEQMYSRRLRSSIDSGDYENMFLLRRGLMWDGSLISGFDADDRYRQVDVYEAATGLLTPDDPWTIAPVENEAFELHHLDPEQELRPVVLDGLKRCFFWDRLSMDFSGALRDINLSESYPFINDPKILQDVGFSVPGSPIPRGNVKWYDTYMQNGAVRLNTEWLGAGSLDLDILRSHFSYVNGEVSLTGPNSDTDILAVDLNYAILAAWVEAWVQLTDRLTATAAQGNRLTSQMVADAFTRKSIAVANERPERFTIRYENVEMLTQVGNTMEPDE